VNRCVFVIVAGTVLALAVPAFAVPPAQPNGTVPSVKKRSEPAGSAKDAHAMTPQQTADATAITKGLGLPGQMLAGDVYRVGIPRTDLHVTLDGVTLAPALALGSYAAFKAEPQGTLVVGDLVLLEPEIGPVMKSLQSSGFRITALHNHLRNESPHVMYMHFMKVGQADESATELRTALSFSKTPLQAPAMSTAEPAFQEAVERGLGTKGKMNGPVLSIGFPRAEAITVQGMAVPPAMGVNVAMNFQDAGSGRVATTGDFVLIASEVDTVERTLRGRGFDVTALHQHMLGDSPTLYYMHFWAVGPPETVAAGLKDALSHVNVKAS